MKLAIEILIVTLPGLSNMPNTPSLASDFSLFVHRASATFERFQSLNLVVSSTDLAKRALEKTNRK